MKRERFTAYGPPDLIIQAVRMFEFADDGVNFTGVGIKGRCLFFPKTNADDRLCKLRLRCSETGEALETCGYVMKEFTAEAAKCLRGRGSLRIAGKKMSRRKKTGLHEYILDLELLDETMH